MLGFKTGLLQQNMLLKEEANPKVVFHFHLLGAGGAGWKEDPPPPSHTHKAFLLKVVNMEQSTQLFFVILCTGDPYYVLYTALLIS